MVYITKEDVKAISGYPIEDIPAYSIEQAQQKVNEAIVQEVEREKVTRIDKFEKTNEIDGENKVFYTKEFPLADKNNDFRVDESDVDAYYLKGDDKVEVGVESIDVDKGKVVLEEAPPKGSTLYFSYAHTNINLNTNKLVRDAAANYAAHLVFVREYGGLPRQMGLGPVYLITSADGVSGYLRIYNEIIRMINKGVFTV